jgi:hypothetical protein
MAIIDPFEAQQPQRRGIVDPFEAQPAPKIVDPFAQTTPPQETTSNPLIGMIGRTASLTGAFVDSVAEVAERVGDKLELAVPLSGIPEEDIKNKKQLQPLFDWAKSLKGFDESLGYQPSTQLKELGSNPLNAIPFIAERVITSVPDMVGAVRVPVAYVMARTKEILDERVKNDEKTLDDATVADVTAAATAAVVEATLERFATKGLFKPTQAATKTGRVAKETGIQAGTEVAEEEVAYLGEAAGTKKGLSAEEALTRGAEAAIVGGGLGATVQGTKELLTPQAAPTQEPATPEQTQLEVEKIAADLTQRGITDIDPERVAQLQQTFQGMGLDPGSAQYRAIEAATLEAEEKAPASEEAQGEPDVGQTIAEPSGDGVPMAGQPDTDTTAGGTGIAEPSGVVPTGQDVAGVATGEAEPAAPIVDPFEQTTQPKPLGTIEYFEKRDELVKQMDEASEESSALLDKILDLNSIARAADVLGDDGKPLVLDESGQFDPDKRYEAVKALEAKRAEALAKFDAVVKQIDELDAARQASKGAQVGTETPEAIQAEAQGQEAAAEPITKEAKTDDVVAEEAEISADVADAVGDITTLPAEEEAVETTAPKAKRGPKGPRQTPEQKAASDERRSQQRKNYKQNVKAVDAAEAALNDSLTDLKAENYGSDVELQEGVESQRIGKIQAIKSLVLLNRALKGTKLGDRVAELLKNPSITAQEIDNVKKGIAAQVSKANAQVKVGRADGRFSDMTNGQQALRHVIKTGNAFQKFLAQRLLPFVKDVNFKVIEEDDALPSQITEGGAEADWDASRGLFLRVVATGDRFVFVRGISGGPSQGINNVTVLHEMLHAALNKKMDLALDAIQSGFDRRSDLAVAYNALLKTIKLTHQRALELAEQNQLPDFMEDLTGAGIWDDPREFVAYAMSDPKFQKFLMETAGHIKQSLFTRFINNVRQFFNMDATHTSALSDIVNITDTMLTARKTPLMRMKEAEEKLSGKMAQVSSQLKKKKAKTDEILQRIETSSFADTIRDYLPSLVKSRSMEDLTDTLASILPSLDNFKLRQILPTLQTEAVVQWAERSGLKGIRESWQYLNDMAAMRNKSTLNMVPVSESLAKLARSAPEQMRRLANVMH